MGIRISLQNKSVLVRLERRAPARRYRRRGRAASQRSLCRGRAACRRGPRGGPAASRRNPWRARAACQYIARADAGPTASSPSPAPATAAAPEVPCAPEVADLALNEDVLLLLGDAPEPEVDFGKPVHKDIASRWQEILIKGLPKEVTENLLKEYLIPQNCDFLVPPILNPEAKVALSDFMVKRDAALSAKQKQIGIALAALSQVVELVINKETSTQKILKPLGDACRVLCDSHFCETKTRRGFVTAAINADVKDIITESPRDKFLFGSNITEQLKSAKCIKESGSVLKQSKNEKSQKFNVNNFIKRKNYNNTQYSSRLNWKTTPRRAPNRQEHRRPSTRRPATRASFQRREKSERSPSRSRRARRR
ncbi:uncharacterized protein LOC125225330 [Leguminivora glycinivorella]|uniref:uncharacterized protein LOC125225330 n=1 Tax=Leguminivora glycinivorella TaxID=1035111 RepID=UPI00200F68B0|nr:uncharacterized protein LOC125225330 [Leguminivora glycinivorella]